MEPAKVRVLLVDDFEPFRKLSFSILQSRQDVLVIGEASDGLEAVRMAEELQPQLVLLDIGLPRLNGIEAARQIFRISPMSKILFMSQESSLEVVEEAFGLGAWAYIVKSDMRRELFAALDAVLRGEKFVGSRFASHDFSGTSDAQATENTQQKEIFLAPQPPQGKIASCHQAEFYSDDTWFLDGFTQFVGAEIKAENPVILIATESHRKGLPPRLQSYGVDLGSAIQRGGYISIDVAETLSTFMVNGQPDQGKFFTFAGDLILAAAKAAKGERPRVVACGECAPFLLAQGEVEAAIRLERLWGEIAKTHDVDILCGYPLGIFHGVEGSYNIHRICRAHSSVHFR